MESHLAAVDNNNLQSQFSHKLNGQVDWIESRSQQKYYPAGGNSYSPVGVRKVRVSLASSNTNSFIEPSSVMFQFKVSNSNYVAGNADTYMYLVNAATAFWRRLTIRCNGQVVTDTDFHHREAELLLMQAPTHKRQELAVQMGQQGTVIQESATFAIPILSGLFL